MKTRNESRQNTRETRQTTIFSLKTAAAVLPDVTRWRHDIVMVLAHIFMLSSSLRHTLRLQHDAPNFVAPIISVMCHLC